MHKDPFVVLFVPGSEALIVSESDRIKWERRYREQTYRPRTHPTPFLEEWLDRLPGGRALDLACGAGRNALRLAEAGYRVDAVDISTSAIARGESSAAQRGLDVNWTCTDLDLPSVISGPYDVIVVARFVNRHVVPQLKEALADNGHIVYEHHILTDQPVDGPKEREFRFRPNELLHLFQDLHVRFYREALLDDVDGRTMALAQLVANKGSPCLA